MGNITPRQHQLLEAITVFTKQHKYSPSIRDMADAIGIRSTSTITYHLKILEEAGYIQRHPKIPRTVTVVTNPEAGPSDRSEIKGK